MDLNWSPEVIMDLIIGTLVFLGSIISFKTPKTNKIKPFFYLKIAFLLYAFMFFVEGISFLFMNTFLARIYSIFSFLSIIFLLIGIDYIMQERINAKKLIPIIILGTLLCYLAFQPDAVEKTTELGYPTIIWTGLFNIIAILMYFIFGIFFFSWIFKTWKYSPINLKKETSILLFWGILIVPITLITYAFSFLLSYFVLISDIILFLGTLMLFYIIIKEPKILYVLPYTAYRIIVKDRAGFPLFNYTWAKSDISEIIFSGLLTAIQQLSEEVLHVGELVDIKLKKGILIFHESKLISVGFIASKSSKFLRDSIEKFSIEFEKKFEKELKESHREISKYKSAIELIEKYFSNLPSRLLDLKKQSLFLSEKYSKLPSDIDNKLKAILKDKKEYDFVKSELRRRPKDTFPEFFDLYDELKEEMDRTSHKDTKESDYLIE